MATTEASKVDVNAVAADLQKQANEATGSKREALLNAAQAMKDQAKQVTDQSKAYLEKVVDKVGILTQHATDKATTHIGSLQATAQARYQGLLENFDKAVKAGQSSGTPAASGDPSAAITTDRGVTAVANGGSANSEGNDAIKFPFNVVTWCTSVCGGKDGHPPAIAGREFNIESLQAQVTAVTEQANAAAASAKEKAAAAAAEATEKAKAVSAEAQQALNEKAAALSEAADAEQKKLREQGEAAMDEAAAQAGAVKEEVGKLKTQVSSAGASS